MSKETEIRILEVETATRRIDYRSPMKFGGRVVCDVTVADAQVLVETRSGKRSLGRGSMTMGNAWAWPSSSLPADRTLAEMTSLFAAMGERLAADSEFGDPLQWGKRLEHAATALSTSMSASSIEAMPVLAERVAISPLDAAIHDGFGRVHGGSSFARLGKEWINEDLGAYLGSEFSGEYLDRWISATPVSRLPLYHLVGALDPLTEGDVSQRIKDGLPETLGEWIEHDGLDHLKIKLAGDDLAWDVARVLAVDAVASPIWDRRGAAVGSYSLDFNERCPNAEYVVEFLDRIRETRPRGFDRIQYLEQPTHRDLRGPGAISMHAAARIKPVVIDESLIDLESLEAARQLGYSGCALKACKGQTDSLLMAAAARKYGLFLCVQDLTCIGASFLHSASLAAHVPTVAAIEGNGRQYCPRGNAGWERPYPGMFRVSQGRVETGELNGMGLGFDWIGVTS